MIGHRLLLVVIVREDALDVVLEVGLDDCRGVSRFDDNKQSWQSQQLEQLQEILGPCVGGHVPERYDR